MALFSKGNIKNLMKKRSIQPYKGLGQHFLVDKNILKKIVEAANLKPTDAVLEIGPGTGVLTQELAKRAKKVIAVEKDKKMVEIVKEVLENSEIRNVEVIQGDILKFDPRTYNLKPKTYKMVANLPYYITSPVIRKFLETDPPSEMILMIQKEVAQRICASPLRSSAKQSEGGQNRMNLLAVSVQFYAEPKIISYVSKNSFWPRPKVDAAVIRIIPRKSALTIRVNPLLFFKVAKAGFSQPRKQILNNLSKILELEKATVSSWLLKNSIQPNQRAETLSIQDWINLTKSFHFK